MTKPILLAGGRVIDPSQSLDRVADVLILDGKIELIGERVANETKNRDGLETIDCTGLVVSPGFVYVHCHLREPGREDGPRQRQGVGDPAGHEEVHAEEHRRRDGKRDRDPGVA